MFWLVTAGVNDKINNGWMPFAGSRSHCCGLVGQKRDYLHLCFSYYDTSKRLLWRGSFTNKPGSSSSYLMPCDLLLWSGALKATVCTGVFNYCEPRVRFGRAAFKKMWCRLSVRPYNNYGDVTCTVLTGAFQGAVTHAHPGSMFRRGLIRQQQSKHTCGWARAVWKL